MSENLDKELESIIDELAEEALRSINNAITHIDEEVELLRWQIAHPLTGFIPEKWSQWWFKNITKKE